MQIINSILCAIKGHRYPIKWTKETLPNNDICESGMADTYQPCVRCGKMSDKRFADIEKMFFNISKSLQEIKEVIKK